MKKIIILLNLLGCCFLSQGQVKTVEGCNFSRRHTIIVSESKNFDTPADAQKVVHAILTAAGWRNDEVIPFEIKPASGLRTCQANLDLESGKRAILYDPDFLQKVKRGFGETDLVAKDWAAIFVMAHEVAHHVKFHMGTSPKPCEDKDCEKDADDWAGFVLYLMGATLEETQLGIKTYINVEEATLLYPSKSERLAIAQAGWKRSQKQAPREAKQPVIIDRNIELNLGIKAYESYNYEEAHRLFLKNEAILEKDNTAALYYGLLFLNGYQIIPQNEKKAIVWLEKSATLGNVEAQYKLALLYYNQDTRTSRKKAFLWCKKAAEGGNVGAQIKLGFFYEEKIGTSRNYSEAFRWYQEAEKQGDTNAQIYIGMMYEQGHYVIQNFEKAFEWYHKSEKKGNLNAVVRLGLCHLQGIGVEKNETEAVALFSKAADGRNANGLYFLATMYEKGKGGLKKDKAVAYNLYQQAADLGSIAAQKYLAPPVPETTSM